MTDQDPQLFRWLLLLVLLLNGSITAYHRHQARSEEMIPRSAESLPLRMSRVFFSVPGMLLILAYLIHPPWISWSSVTLPAWSRWIGVGLGLAVAPLNVWMLRSLGKNISGAGLDTNVTGRSVYGYTAGVPWCDGMPRILRIAVMDVSDESDGNAVGMGQVDFVPERFAKRVDREVTTLNAVTACAPTGARMPVVLADDRQAILTALRTSPIRAEGPLVVYVKDTLELEHVLLSEGCRSLVEDRDDLEIVSDPAPLQFDDRNRLQSPFA